jgi:hypothetical protein
MKRIVKSVFGLLSLLMGTAILVWCAYCLFVPNKYFQWRLIDIPRLVVPLVMVWLGWNWIRGSAIKGRKYTAELTVTVKLSGSDFGMQAERKSILALKHKLEDQLIGTALGEIDGEEFGGGECNLFVQTNAPAETERLIRSFFTAEAPSLVYSVSNSDL